MRIHFFIILLFRASTTYSQAPESLEEKVYEFNFTSKQPDSAIYYYDLVKNIYPSYQSPRLQYLVAFSYLQKKDTIEAKKIFLECLTIDNVKDVVGIQYLVCEKLGDVYFEQKEYRKALTYFELSTTKYILKKRMCDHGHRRIHTDNKKAICYYYLHQKDSCLSILAPIVFRDYYDSDFVEETSSFFVKTAFEVYGKEKAKETFLKAVDNIFYNARFEKEEGGIKWVHIDCYFLFANAKVNLNSGSDGLDSYDIPEYLSKKSFVEELKETPAYKYIVGERMLPTEIP